MCLIFLAYRQHPEYPLVVVANRDEYYDRPTRPLDVWPEYPHILAGKDLQGGGTWLGITRAGHLALVTNYRDMRQPDKPRAPSRGKLVLDYLLGGFEPPAYLQALHATANRYNGYNLIAGTVNDPWYYSNQSDRIVRLGSGLYGLSNALLDTPWPKVTKGKAQLARLLQQARPEPEAFFRMMTDSEEAPDKELPDTGIGYEYEKKLSAMFIRMPGYGTRNTTLILVHRSGETTITERTWYPDSSKYEDRTFRLSLAAT